MLEIVVHVQRCAAQFQVDTYTRDDEERGDLKASHKRLTKKPCRRRERDGENWEGRRARRAAPDLRANSL